MIDILSVLLIGKDNAKHQTELAAVFNCKPAAIKKAVRDLRLQGVPICSGQAGYWIAADNEEISLFLRSMKKQAVSRFISTKEIKQTLKKYQGQQVFDLSEGGGATNGKENIQS